jgi:hypothetical protein
MVPFSENRFPPPDNPYSLPKTGSALPALSNLAIRSGLRQPRPAGVEGRQSEERRKFRHQIDDDQAFPWKLVAIANESPKLERVQESSSLAVRILAGLCPLTDNVDPELARQGHQTRIEPERRSPAGSVTVPAY